LKPKRISIAILKQIVGAKETNITMDELAAMCKKHKLMYQTGKIEN
jgi:hypothetical protein